MYPQLLKVSKVIALFKSGVRHVTNNYRPISLLDIFDKIYEKLLYKRFVKFLNKYNLLFKFQFAYRDDHSASLALTDITDCIKSTIENNGYTIGILIDLSKAFDAVDHAILFEKLPHYGIRGKALSLIKSYLTNRTQFTVINGVSSDTKPVTCGVPQGSVLGPLLFLLFINDIQFCTSKDITRLFADDTGIFVHGNTLQSALKSAQEELDKLEKWFKANKLTLNVKKCAYIIFRGRNKRIPDVLPNLCINRQEIERVETFKYIGLHLDYCLSYKAHVEYVCNKLNRFFGVFSQLRYKIPDFLVRQTYYSTIFPIINYGLIVYGSCSKSLLNKIQTKQNSLLKFLTKKDRLYPTNELHLNYRILKVKNAYDLLLVNFVHSCLRNTVIPIFQNYFKLQRSRHSYNMRKKLNIVIPKTTSKTGSSTVKFMGAKIWNGCPVAHKYIDFSKYTIKKHVFNSFIESYRT